MRKVNFGCCAGSNPTTGFFFCCYSHEYKVVEVVTSHNFIIFCKFVRR